MWRSNRVTFGPAFGRGGQQQLFYGMERFGRRVHCLIVSCMRCVPFAANFPPSDGDDTERIDDALTTALLTFPAKVTLRVV